MDLLLWRHAQAADTFPDFERELTAHGREQAQLLAGWLSENAPANLRILVSPATRTQQTICAWTDKYETTEQVGLSTTVPAVLRAIDWPNLKTPLLIVGHEPTLSELASELLPENEACHGFKKGELWWISAQYVDGELITRLEVKVHGSRK